MNAPDQLFDAIDRLLAFLRSTKAPGAAHWAAQIQNARRELGHTPPSLAGRLLSFFGGMGSLNDIVIGSGPEADQLEDLGERLYQACLAMAREHGE